MTGIYSELKKFLNPRTSLVIEAGGHRGIDTQSLAQLAAHVDTFEGNPHLVTTYLKPLESAKITVYPFALGAKNEDRVSFYLDANPEGDAGASSLLPSLPAYKKDYLKKEIPIQVTTRNLGDFIAEKKRIVDLIWLDVEGSEYTIVTTLTRVKDWIRSIYVEVNFQAFREGHKSYADIVALFSQMGFESCYQESQGSLIFGEWQGNILFRNLKLVPTRKILHLSFHKGTVQDFQSVIQELYGDWTQVTFFDAHKMIDANYNMGRERANKIWHHYQDYFEQFDLIVTSDTAPLCRIFLQDQHWKKPLLVWICNRFDYYDARTNDCQFPDPEYYDLIRSQLNSTTNQVRFIGYTPFENHYAQAKYQIQFPFMISPMGSPLSGHPTNLPSDSKRVDFFVPPYHNDTLFCNLVEKIRSWGLTVESKRYNGPNELQLYKAIIHIPYQWSTLAYWEGLSRELIYVIPSREFFQELSQGSNFWFANCEFLPSQLHLSEWYNPEHKDCVVFFESWHHLENLLQHGLTVDFLKSKKATIQRFWQAHQKETLEKWQKMIQSF